MSDKVSNSAGRSLARRVASIAIGLLATLIVGAAAERLTSAEWLADAEAAQARWIDAVASTSPTNSACS